MLRSKNYDGTRFEDYEVLYYKVTAYGKMGNRKLDVIGYAATKVDALRGADLFSTHSNSEYAVVEAGIHLTNETQQVADAMYKRLSVEGKETGRDGSRTW